MLIDDYAVVPVVATGGTTLMADTFTTGPGWDTSKWEIDFRYGGVADIQSNKGHLRVDAGGNWATRALGKPATQHSDGELTVTVTPTELGNANTMVWLRGASTFNPTYNGYLYNGYYLRFNYSANKFQLRKHFDGNDPDWCGGPSCTLAETTQTWASGTAYKVRFKAVGSTLQAKIWTGSTEPPAWTFTATDTAYGSGRSALTIDNWDSGQAKNVTFDDYTLALPADIGYPAPVASFDVQASYNTLGLVESVIEPSTPQHPNVADRTWTSVYDNAGLLITDKQPGGIDIASTYDALGRMTAQSSGAASKSFTYDLAGRLASISHPTAAQSFFYDDRGLMVGAGGPAGNVVATYDADRRMIGRDDPAGVHVFTWNNQNELASVVDPLTLKTTSYTYNDARQITRADYGLGAGQPNRVFTYDTIGRLETDLQKDGAGNTTMSTSYIYDADSRITTETLTMPANPAAGTSTYTYDRAGRAVTFKRVSGGTTQVKAWTYDQTSNRLKERIDNTTPTVWAYDARNRIQTETAPAGTVKTSTWDPRGTLDKITTGATTHVDTTFDALGRLTTMVSGGSTMTYSYDALDRIAKRNTTQVFTYNGTANDASTADGTKYSRTPTERLLSVSKGGTARLATLNRQGDLRMLTDNAGIVKDTNIYDPNGVAIARTNTGGITHGDLGYKSAYTDPNPTNTGDVKTGTGWYTPGTATNRSIRAEIPQLRATRGKLQTPTPLNTQTLGSLSSGVPNAGLCGDCGTPQIATPQITDIIEDNAGNSPEPAVEEPVATEQLQPDTTTTPDTTNQQEGATTNGDTPGQDTPDCGQCGQQEQTTQTGGADTTSTDTGQTGGATDQHNGDFCDAIWGCAVAMCTPSSSVNACEGSGGGGGGALPTCGSTEHIEDWGFGPICVPNYTPPPQPTPTTPFDPCTDLGFCRPDSRDTQQGLSITMVPTRRYLRNNLRDRRRSSTRLQTSELRFQLLRIWV